MPLLVKQYGSNTQFDIISTIDQDKYMDKNKKAAISGFSIDKKGRIKGILNFVSYIKLAPEDLVTEFKQTK